MVCRPFDPKGDLTPSSNAYCDALAFVYVAGAARNEFGRIPFRHRIGDRRCQSADLVAADLIDRHRHAFHAVFVANYGERVVLIGKTIACESACDIDEVEYGS